LNRADVLIEYMEAGKEKWLCEGVFTKKQAVARPLFIILNPIY
jgi:hypothetical protein